MYFELFEKPCDDMEAHVGAWLSLSKFLQRAFKLRQEYYANLN